MGFHNEYSDLMGIQGDIYIYSYIHWLCVCRWGIFSTRSLWWQAATLEMSQNPVLCPQIPQTARIFSCHSLGFRHAQARFRNRLLVPYTSWVLASYNPTNSTHHSLAKLQNYLVELLDLPHIHFNSLPFFLKTHFIPFHSYPSKLMVQYVQGVPVEEKSNQLPCKMLLPTSSHLAPGSSVRGAAPAWRQSQRDYFTRWRHGDVGWMSPKERREKKGSANGCVWKWAVPAVPPGFSQWIQGQWWLSGLDLGSFAPLNVQTKPNCSDWNLSKVNLWTIK